MNALETNRNKKKTGVVDWMVSGLRVLIPRAANSQNRLRLIRMSRPAPSRQDRAPAWKRNPTASPAAIASAAPSNCSARSDRLRPVSGARAGVGSDRKRSIRPAFASSASPVADCSPPKMTFWISMAGTR